MRFVRRRRRRPLTLERQPDALPKTGLFAEPIRVARLDAMTPEVLDDGQVRATFLVELRDGEDKRCSQIAVTGPTRTRTVQGATDLLGRIRFRMAAPPGRVDIRIDDVAAGGLEWDATAGPTTASSDTTEAG